MHGETVISLRAGYTFIDLRGRMMPAGCSLRSVKNVGTYAHTYNNRNRSKGGGRA